MNPSQKNKVLETLAQLIEKNEQAILKANQLDISACTDIDASMLDRLKIDENKIVGMAAALREAIKLEDPEGKILSTYHPENGLKIENKTVPFGKILIIYESRPDVTVEAATVAFKAGNKVLLKGGKEARETNLLFVKLWHESLSFNGLEKDHITYLDFSREETQTLIKANTHQVDLIIPRGGQGLIDFVRQNTTVPLIISGRGNNFLYVDKEVDFEMAVRIILDGKQRVSVCNALDKVLLHQDLPDLQSKIALLVEQLKAKEIEILGDERCCELNDQIQGIKDQALYGEEFLSAKLLLGLVKDTDEAIGMINRYSGGHSASIITTDAHEAEKFQKEVDCAAVYHNASTRFTDGGQFGFGSEVAISTQKLHFRGPIGVDQLVTNKWFIYGEGQVRN